MAVRAAPEPAPGEPDLDLPRCRRLLEVPQLQRRGGGAGLVVLVGDRRAEDAIEVRALVPEGQLEEVAAVPGQDPLRATDQLVELPGRLGVVVVVDPGEANEQRDRRAQLGQELPASRAQPLVHGGQQPRSDEVLGQRRRLDDLASRGQDLHRCEDAVFAAGLGVEPSFAEHHAIPEPRDRRGLEHDLALLREVLSRSEIVDQASSEDVDQLDVGVADDEPARFANGDRDLHREADLAAPGGRDQPGPFDGSQHREARRCGGQPVVAVDPAGDGVAREVDDVPAERVELGDDGVEDPAEVGCQLLGASLRTELGRERLGERCEAADVGEDRSAADAVWEVETGRERAPAITSDVRLGMVDIDLRRQAGRAVGRRLGGGRRRRRVDHSSLAVWASPGVGPTLDSSNAR